MKSEAADQPDPHGDVKNGEPGPECGQPGVRHGDTLSLSDSEDSFEPKRK